MNSSSTRAVVFFAGVSIAAVAQTRPNFSGTWKLTAESVYPSNVPTRLVRVVEQQGNELRCSIERELNGKVDKSNYELTVGDSMPTGDPEPNVWAQWKGDTLTVTLIAASGVRQIENWSLSEDGKKVVDMTVVRRPDGKEVSIRRVFDKQQ